MKKHIFGVIMLCMVGFLYAADDQPTLNGFEISLANIFNNYTGQNRIQRLKVLRGDVQNAVFNLPENDRNKIKFLDFNDRRVTHAIKQQKHEIARSQQPPRSVRRRLLNSYQEDLNQEDRDHLLLSQIPLLEQWQRLGISNN